MTRAPRIVVEVDDALWADCCKSLGMAPQRIRWRRFPPKEQHGDQIFGQAQDNPPMIFMYLTPKAYDTARFRDLRKEIIVTLLHELKHLHQFKTWPDAEIEADKKLPYSFRKMEKDAEAWAQQNRGKWVEMIRVKRVFAGPLSKIAATERSLVR